MIKVFVATPTTGTIADAQPRVIRLLAERYKDKVELVFPKETIRRMFHDYARNAMIEEFLETDADILWFLDSDIVPPLHILDLVTEHGDEWMVAGAPYPIFICPEDKSTPKVVMAVFNGTDGKGLHATKVPYSGTEFVDGVATGCLFIKREVFNQIERPFFEFKYDPKSRTIVEGEDLGFCFKMNALGYKFFVDYSMPCKHYKSVCLLDVNNYAIDYANKALRALEEQLRAEFKVAALQMARDIKSKLQNKPSTLWTPS